MKSSRIIGFVLLYLATTLDVSAQAPVSPPANSPARTEPVEPFRIVDNIYFVGTTLQNASYLITGSEGHIIIDTLFEASVPQVLENVETLGFEPGDIKLIIGSHAHSDHVAGHSLMRERTGARILSSAADKAVVETGGKADFRDRGEWTPATVDRVIGDGEEIRLGDIVLTAHLTPGHTRGCTTFTSVAEVDGNRYDVLLLCGVRIAAEPLVGNSRYPDMARDFAATFVKLNSLPVDIYLGAHGYWFNLGEKIERMKRGEGYKAFIDPRGYRAAIAGWQQEFIDQLVIEAYALQGSVEHSEEDTSSGSHPR